MRILRFISLALVTSTSVWFFWSLTGHGVDHAPSADPSPMHTTALGQPGKQGNLLAVQPWLRTQDYATSATLERKLATYLQSAFERGWLQGGKTIAVFPEYTGTWLVAADEKAAAIEAADVGSAMTAVALTHLPEFLYRMATAPAVAAADKWALFTLKAESMATAFETVFSNLARRFGIYVVAGSTVLPQPEIVDGHLRVHPGSPLVNVSALFGPDGRIVPPLVIKAFPIADEQTFLASGDRLQQPVFDTPAGKLAVLICADAWFPQAYTQARERGATLMAVPSFSAGDGIWNTPWGGYSGAPNAADVDMADIGKLTEGQAWNKYAMQARAAKNGVHTAANVFLRGQLWDLGSDGATLALQGGQAFTAPTVNTAALTNIWIH
jgi:predicted amidohydrolase